MLDGEGRARALKVVPVDWIDNKKMVPREGEEFEIECSLIVGATGQSSDFTGFEEFDNGRGWVEADGFFRVKGKPKHFVGGDAINPDLLTTAIGHGWKAAEGISTFVTGGELKKRPKVDVHHFRLDTDKPFAPGWADVAPAPGTAVYNFEDRSQMETQGKDVLFLAHFEPTPINRRETKQLAPDELVGNFEERLSPLTEEQVMAEAERCMSCGICLECNNCVIQCPEMAVRWVIPGERSVGRFVATDHARCVGCGICADVCPTGYIGMELPE
jgi:Pyruvate/2-oxoacid:ferredoxin oxidoreductase delta subunit